jgi:hypothetical protein
VYSSWNLSNVQIYDLLSKTKTSDWLIKQNFVGKPAFPYSENFAPITEGEKSEVEKNLLSHDLSETFISWDDALKEFHLWSKGFDWSLKPLLPVELRLSL